MFYLSSKNTADDVLPLSQILADTFEDKKGKKGKKVKGAKGKRSTTAEVSEWLTVSEGVNESVNEYMSEWVSLDVVLCDISRSLYAICNQIR